VVACGGKVSKHKSWGEKFKQTKGAPYSAPLDSAPFAEIRAKHPNAYRPWNKEQDEELTKLFSDGISIPDLTKKFGRKRGAITSRLEKLGLRER